MIRILSDKKSFYASIVMSAILMLHVALASISPTRLFASASGLGVDSYIRVMDVTSSDGGATGIDGRSRVVIGVLSDRMASEGAREHHLASSFASPLLQRQIPREDILPDQIPSNLSSRK